MKRILFSLLLLCSVASAVAQKVAGTVTDNNGQVLAYASITVKGTGKGAVANSLGRYNITLDPGNYTFVCQFVGYKAEEKKVTVPASSEVNFSLAVQDLTMQEVVIKRGEDPALEIIRETIRKRDFYNKQVDSFTVDVYIKGLMRSRGLPDKFMGQKIDKSDMGNSGLDSAGKGILFLSESLTRVSFTQPNKIKYQVLSSRESGGGYGLSFPFFINFYTNNVAVFDNRLNPRGFISPIADGAFHYYRFRYEGAFTEGNQLINRIRVTPKRKHEPLFNGYLQIIDGEWRIHSLDLVTTSEYQLELIDTIRVSQIHAPVTQEVWRTRNQTVYVAVKKFGFDITGNFLNVYTDYNLDPGFGKKYFNRVIMSYDTAFNKKDSAYWSRVRPVTLEPDEKRDFVVKDSLSKAYRDSMFSPRTLDSLRRKQKPVSLRQFLVGGVSRSHWDSSGFRTYRFEPLVKNVQYNSVEGLAIRVSQSLSINRRRGRNSVQFNWDTRYGLSNQRLNASLMTTIKPMQENFRNRYLQFGGGKRMSQINPDNPIDPLTNALYTLIDKKNYMKLYQNWFGTATYNNRFENGLRWTINTTWEDRIPQENHADFSLFNKEASLLPNHPYELKHYFFTKHQALVATVQLSFQPGQRYIQFPYRKQPIGSDYPTFELLYAKGFKEVLGSDVDFDKWRFAVSDNMNMKIAGEFRYRLGVGGFLNNNSVGMPDLQHFNGNQTFYNTKYLNSFQLAPYYQYSNQEPFFAFGHVEHHFNGLFTNKIPLFNRLKWHLVGGANTFYVNRDQYYLEAFAGIENILKLFRVDFVTAYQSQPGSTFGVRIGMGGIIGGLARFNED